MAEERRSDDRHDGERIDTGGEVRRDYAPEGEASKSGLASTLKRTLTEFQEDNLSDWAAALTYYGLLSLFPALIAMVSIVGLVGDPQKTTKTLLDIVAQLGPETGVETFRGPIEGVTQNRSGAGLGLIIGIALSL